MDPYIKHLIVVFLIPVIPAFLFYKIIPSKTFVKGPFQGLQIDMSGAFAGYFLLLLMIFVFMSPPGGNWEIWKVTGEIKLADEETIIEKSLLVSVQPALHNVFSNGGFSFNVIRTPDQSGTMKFPELIVEYPSYRPYSLDLNDASETELTSRKEVKLTTPIVLKERPGS